MYKSTTGNLQLTAHVFQPNVFTGNILQPIISNNTTPSTPAGNRSVYGGYENPNVVIAYNNQNVFTVPNNTAYGGTGQSMVVMLNYNDTTKNFTGLLNQPVPGTITYNGNAGITATSMSSVNAGVRLVTAGNAYTWAEIDYVRWYSIGDWFPA
jgi:hypothetical protein